MSRTSGPALPLLALTAVAVFLTALAFVNRWQKAARRDGAATVIPGQVDTVIADVDPELVTRELPFQYPASLYEQRAQGNVTLRLRLDSTGTPIADSTQVHESSGVAALDSAAVAGAKALRFRPAMRGGRAVEMALLFPVYFRHPGGKAMPGDSVLSRP